MNTQPSVQWRLRQFRYRLVGVHCLQCGRPLLSGRLTCPYCAQVNHPYTQAVFSSKPAADIHLAPLEALKLP